MSITDYLKDYDTKMKALGRITYHEGDKKPGFDMLSVGVEKLRETGVKLYFDRVNNRNYLIGNLENKDKVAEELLKNRLAYTLNTSGDLRKVSDMIKEKTTLDLSWGIANWLYATAIDKSFEERPPLPDYNALQKTYEDDKVLKDYLFNLLDKRNFMKANEITLFADKRAETLYGIINGLTNSPPFEYDFPDSLTKEELKAYLNFDEQYGYGDWDDIRNIYDTALETLKTANKRYAYGGFYRELSTEDKDYFSRLVSEGTIALDLDDLFESIEGEVPHDLDIKGTFKTSEGEFFVYEMTDEDRKAYEYADGCENKIFQHFSVLEFITPNTDITAEGLREAFEKQFATDNIYVDYMSIDKVDDGYVFNLSARTEVTYFEDKSVGVSEFEGSFEHENDAKEYIHNIIENSMGLKSTSIISSLPKSERFDNANTLMNKKNEIDARKYKGEDEYIEHLNDEEEKEMER